MVVVVVVVGIVLDVVVVGIVLDVVVVGIVVGLSRDVDVEVGRWSSTST